MKRMFIVVVVALAAAGCGGSKTKGPTEEECKPLADAAEAAWWAVGEKLSASKELEARQAAIVAVAESMADAFGRWRATDEYSRWFWDGIYLIHNGRSDEWDRRHDLDYDAVADRDASRKSLAGLVIELLFAEATNAANLDEAKRAELYGCVQLEWKLAAVAFDPATKDAAMQAAFEATEPCIPLLKTLSLGGRSEAILDAVEKRGPEALKGVEPDLQGAWLSFTKDREDAWKAHLREKLAFAAAGAGIQSTAVMGEFTELVAMRDRVDELAGQLGIAGDPVLAEAHKASEALLAACTTDAATGDEPRRAESERHDERRGAGGGAGEEEDDTMFMVVETNLDGVEQALAADPTSSPALGCSLSGTALNELFVTKRQNPTGARAVAAFKRYAHLCARVASNARSSMECGEITALYIDELSATHADVAKLLSGLRASVDAARSQCK